MEYKTRIAELVEPIANDLSSGAAEIALQAITVFRTVLNENESAPAEQLTIRLIETAKALLQAQPAMAPMFHLGNTVLIETRNARTNEQIAAHADAALNKFEQRLCTSASLIADHVLDLIPFGEQIFAYSFSSTVVSSLLHAKAARRYFRVVCTEARPSMEGRKLATVLSQAGIEVMHTFDSAMGLVLPQCRAAFMGCDSVGRPGIVNKVGSWLLATACQQLGIPLYALAATEKFVTDERLFEFEDHERSGTEIWPEAPSAIRLCNQQYEVIPHSWIAGLITEHGLMKEAHIDQYVSKMEVHEALKIEGALLG
jgi:translation initiation factor 2B subunit (eIF-2B alpha/beta/delta family)